MRETLFSNIAQKVAYHLGRAHTFVLAVLVVLVWGAIGPLCGFSDTWQLVINTGTTIATFLMIFVLQHTQNRDTIAIQLKLDELIASSATAENRMLDLEALSEDDLRKLKAEFVTLANGDS